MITPEGFADWRRLGVYNGTAVFLGVSGGKRGWYVVCPSCQTQQESDALAAAWSATQHNQSAAHQTAGRLF